MRLDPSQRVTYYVAQKRVLKSLAELHPAELGTPNMIAGAIWPDHKMTSQGAGAAASRILKRMSTEGLTEWHSANHHWGWRLTPAGKRTVAAAGICDVCEGGHKLPKRFHGLDCPKRQPGATARREQ